MNITPEIHELCTTLKQKPPYRAIAPQMFTEEIIGARSMGSLRICYWEVGIWPEATKYLCLYRFDRPPNNVEVMPFLQELFDNGTIHEVSVPDSPFREFFQGSEIYINESMVDKMADAVVNHAEKHDDIE